MREALHNTRDKHDAKDAQVILHMLSSGNVQRYYEPTGSTIGRRCPKRMTSFPRQRPRLCIG